ncbi:hypothetical protein ACVIWV_006228 [Bradyrhizobium diazoefficiens]|uniref:Abi-alpha family protein n=1 Tax=Bradyrhizobium TaxID=374 RepID=UPI0007660DD3|nr:hypothetical protein [Bradyrhizobium diazoefficiens]MBR0862263.1 hypothetical protein [Bradyrhizobium diazoefficiens]MBR0886665.1 hypothetical protein [Bradyrhizobium diazoefficiens]MBR0918571.1 hypothetical protein [Bradyrhizobium diazoefficiens]
MNDKRPDLPYEKAAEETAKTIGKGLDLVNRAAPAIGDAYGFLIGDRIQEQRARNADKMARETKRILDDRNLKETCALPEDLADPLLEAVQREPREEILRLYAALAANAMDPNHDDVRPEFVETVRKWQPIDVRVMNFAVDRRSTSIPYFSPGDMHQPGVRESAIQLSIDHLVELKCMRHNPTNGYVISAYGSEIMLAVSEQT